ncbi:Polyadenylate-binding protein 2 [Rhynchospora pubera]|uniref:Polyadenylate-binding protein 2 n=1 Tax=Rhynchospora pubera TaxID=906938 RepID=A0AAV8CWI9_9POAL|nr:Polyadenylate-binding protein 2 [Rhynchospora pubera]
MDGESFKGDFTTDGVSVLQERLREKLRELMEDYADESLVDYVIVLLKNGRSKDDAIKELHVFLGDQSTSFISWLWEHLSVNSHLYLKEDAPTPISISNSANDNGHKRDNSRKSIQPTDDSTEKMETDTASRKDRKDQHRRGQQETFPLRSVVSHILHGEERNKQSSSSLKQCDFSSKTRSKEKRLREEDEQQPQKRGGMFINVSRRLLQSAVRDAVKPVPQVQRTSSSSEPALKRLRSVVLTSPKEKKPDAIPDHRPRRIRSTLNASGSLIALKAAAEAAESTSKPRNSRSVFDRLTTRIPDSGKRSVERENVDFDRFEASKNNHLDRADEIAKLDEQKEIMHESTFEIDSLEDDVAKDMSPEQDLMDATSSDEIVDLSVNTETCKEPNASKTSDDTKELVGPFSGEKENTITSIMPKAEKSCTAEIKEESTDAQKELRKTSSTQVPASYATSHPLVDVDSRTVFVSNVNFAATKDALSRHFNKFGAVLKVVLINDPTTGQPTGSACVEFLSKESAELALSVNGTSFMSRIVKVVRRNSSEAAQFLGLARGGRASSSFGMYPRGAAFRGRPPIRPGARSLQWKRGTSSTAQPLVESTNTDAK